MDANFPVLQFRAWHVAKDTAYAAEYEDALCFDADNGRAAIADGVGGAIFSGRWARILTRSLIANPPNLDESGGWVKWLAEPRRLWLEDIDFPNMPINKKNKLRQVGGAFCTVCWLEFQSAPNSEGALPRTLLKGFAMGDSCLLQIRDRVVVKSFPITKSEEFDLDPDSICSVATSRDSQQSLSKIEIECHHGDVIVMVTDAIAKWMYEGVEKVQEARWEQLWALDEAEWIEAIGRLRDSNAMKRDDTTMVVVQIGAGTPAWEVQPLVPELAAATAGPDSEVEAVPDAPVASEDEVQFADADANADDGPQFETQQLNESEPPAVEILATLSEVALAEGDQFDAEQAVEAQVQKLDQRPAETVESASVTPEPEIANEEPNLTGA